MSRIHGKVPLRITPQPRSGTSPLIGSVLIFRNPYPSSENPKTNMAKSMKDSSSDRGNQFASASDEKICIYNPKPWVRPPLSNSWIIIIIWLYIALNRTPNIDCYWVGGSTQPKPYIQNITNRPRCLPAYCKAPMDAAIV